MAAGPWTFFKRSKYKLLSSGINFSGGSFRAHLFTSAAALGASNDVSTLGSITGQLAATRGYATSGAAVASPNLYFSVNNVLFSAAGVCWSAAGGNLGSTTVIRYVVLALSAGLPIAFAQLSSAGFAVPSGSALKINGGTASAAKIFELS